MRKMGAKQVIVEPLYLGNDNELDEELNALNRFFDRKPNKKLRAKNYKLVFISKQIKSVNEIKLLKDSDFLATTTIVNFKYPYKKYIDKYKNEWHSYIYKAIIKKPESSELRIKKDALSTDYYLHITNIFNCQLSLSAEKSFKYKINGTIFFQQNGLTSVCAHASICMLLNNRNKRRYRNYTPETINKILKIDHIKENRVEKITTDDIDKIFKRFKLKTVMFDFYENPEYDYASFLYHHIEGGNPSLLIFSTKDPDNTHVVPIFGHTLNTNIWDAEAELFYNVPGASEAELAFIPGRSNDEDQRKASSSVAWVDHFIMHDDNYGAYLNLPVDSLRKKTLPRYDWEYRAYKAISIVPENVFTKGFESEGMSIKVIKNLLSHLKGTNKWLKRLHETKAPFVIRTLLVSKNEYRKHLNGGDFTGNCFTIDDKSILLKHLPELFWLNEITLPDLYTANETKLIDIIYSCGKGKPNIKKVLLIRLPGAVFFPNRRGKAKKIPIAIKSHYPLLSKS
jgi:hypothetical protein